MSLAVPGVEGLQEVGRGGGGVVYRAWQPDFGRWVAVKVFAADEDVRRLERERLAVGRLSDHPGIVPVLDGGLADGRPYLIMAYMDGGSLADRVAARGAVPPDELVGFGRAMCTALQVAHDNGVLHRDIKPANILYDRFGTPRLADFGIAHLGDNAFRTEAGSVSGTVAYMAPELIDGRPFTAAADVFSLGATLYYALEGRHLFEPRPNELYAAFLVRRITAPHEPAFSPAVPGWLRDVVVAATEPDQARRLPTAAALDEALARGATTSPTGPTRALRAGAGAGAAAPPPPPPLAPPAQGYAAPPPPPSLPPPPGGVAQPWTTGQHGADGQYPSTGGYGPPWGTPGPPLPANQETAPHRGRPLAVGGAAVAVIAVATALWLNASAGRRSHDPTTSPGSSRSAGVTPPTSEPSAAARTAGAGPGASPAGGPSAPPSDEPSVAADPGPSGAVGAKAVQEALAAYRAAVGGGDPLALEMVFYPFPDENSGAYAVATLPQRSHPAQADRYDYRDGQVGPPQPVPSSGELAANKRWRFGEVTWSAMPTMLKNADAVCRRAMSKAGITDEADTFGRKAGISHVIVERDTVFNDGHVIVRVYFSGGARWLGGYVPFSASGKVLTTQYCTVSS